MNNLHFIQQAAVLMAMPRSHSRNLWNTFDSVASHSRHVAIIVFVLCQEEKLSQWDQHSAVLWGVFHDFCETRTLDHDLISKRYNKINENLAVKETYSSFPWWETLEKMHKEYEEKEKKRTHIVKDADHIAQIYHEWTLMRQGNKLAANRWKYSLENRNLRTESAKKVIASMQTSNPHERWRDLIITKENT